MGEIETQAIRGDQGAFLRDVVAERSTQGFMQQMSGRMIRSQTVTAGIVDRQ